MTESMVFDTPESIEYFRLASLKGRVKLEKVGMRGRGGQVTPIMRKEFGLKARASHDEVIAAIQKRMDELLCLKEHGPNNACARCAL